MAKRAKRDGGKAEMRSGDREQDIDGRGMMVGSEEGRER
jgi:hypothetical protein